MRIDKPSAATPNEENAAEMIATLLPLVSARASVLHGPMSDGGRGSTGGDFDCIVSGLDRWWPLRLDPAWNLCQCLHYDLKAWCWVLDRAGEVVALDVLDDPRGVGGDAFSAVPAVQPDGLVAPSHQRAAYLTAKRIRKGVRDSEEWQAIGEVARVGAASYRTELEAIFGRSVGTSLADEVLTGRVPSDDLWRSARRAQFRRRVGGPFAMVGLFVLVTRRIAERALHPTGLFVLVVGPDGAGKSTVAEGLPDACAGLFRRYRRVHWRPGLLPRPGALLLKGESDPSEPHTRSVHGKLASVALLGYHWLDFFFGGWFRLWPIRTRTGMIVVERGWWDLAVDPVRYRLQVPAQLVKALGALLPHPDIAFVLESSPELLHHRKSELAPGELARQLEAWKHALPRGVRQHAVDVSATPQVVTGSLRNHIVDGLERREVSRLGQGWTSLPSRDDPRWWLPRGPRAVARGALSIYQPVTTKARTGWEGARLLAAIGAFRLLPRGQAPPRAVRKALAAYIPAGGTLAVAKVDRPGRYVAFILGRRGERVAAAKVAMSALEARALAAETRAIREAAGSLPPPLSCPNILAEKEGLLLMEAVDWHPRVDPWRLPEDVARALGAFFRSATGSGGSPQGLTHGDCAPWNLLRSATGWTLVDWEGFRDDGPPFFDLFHYVVQSHVLLGKPSREVILQGLAGLGWVGGAIRAYAEGAGMPATSARNWFGEYLEQSRERLPTDTADARKGLRARDALLAGIGSDR